MEELGNFPEEEMQIRRYDRWWERDRDKIITRCFTPRLQKDLRQFKDEESFDVEIIKNLRFGNLWLFITGDEGSGKSVLAARYMLESIYEAYVYKTNPTVYDHLFVTFPDMLVEIRKSMNPDSDVKESQVLDRFRNAGMLIIDDLGASKVTDWAWTMVYIIINYRYEYLLPTIFTSNLNYEELADVLDLRIAGRISQMSQVIELKDDRKRTRPKI